MRKYRSALFPSPRNDQMCSREVPDAWTINSGTPLAARRDDSLIKRWIYLRPASLKNLANYFRRTSSAVYARSEPESVFTGPGRSSAPRIRGARQPFVEWPAHAILSRLPGMNLRNLLPRFRFKRIALQALLIKPPCRLRRQSRLFCNA